MKTRFAERLLTPLNFTSDFDVNPGIVTFKMKILALLGMFIFSISALAMSGKTTYQAKIIKPDGYPLEAVNVNFKFSVLDTVGSCVLYSETYSAINMTATSGLISFALGSGARSFPPASATTAVFSNVFDNSIVSMPCEATGIYNPLPNDTRRIVMQFNDGTGWQTLPAMTINAVPYAMYANKSNDAKTLNGKADTAFVETSTLASLNCQSNEAIHFNGVSFSCIPVGASSSGISSVTTSGSVLLTGGTASAPVISIQAATVSQDGYLTSLDYAEFKAKLSASSTQIINTLGYAPVSAAAVTTQINSSNLSGDVSGTVSANSVVSVGGKSAAQVSTSVDATLAATSSSTADTIVKRNSSGNVTINDLYANAAKINYADIYRPSTSFNIRLQAPTSLSANYSLTLPETAGVSGQVITTDGAGNLSWINAATGSITNINVNAPLSSTGGATPTISISQATSSTSGYLSSADWNTFSNKQQATSAAIIATLGYTPADNAASGTYAQKANNLSDLTNFASARANLGLGTLATASSIDLGSASATGTLSTARLPSFSGDVNSVSGSNLISLNTVGPGVTSGTQYTKVTVDGKGRVTSGAQLSSSDVTNALGYTPATSTTLAASFVQKTGDTMTGALNLPSNGLVVGTNQLVVSGSNIGIGAVNPTAALEIKAGTTSLAPLKLTSGTLLSSQQSGAMEYDGFNFYLTDSLLSRRAIATGSSVGTIDAQTINSSSNISLVPNSSVIVSSTAASTNSSTGALVVKGGLGVAGSINAAGNLNVSGSSVIDGTLKLSSMTSGSVLFAGVNGTVTQDNSSLYWDGANKRLGLGTNSPSQTLSVSGVSYFSGNVGIGTTSPTRTLHVVGSQMIERFAASPQIVLRGGANSATGSDWEFHINSTTGNLFLARDPSDGSLNDNSPILTATTSGNIGIGTATPATKLDVNGAINVSGDGSQVGYYLPSGLAIRSGNATGNAYLDVANLYVRNGVGANAGAKLHVAGGAVIGNGYAANSPPGNGMIIEGNVGIGTSSPTDKLEIATSGATTKNGISITGGEPALRLTTTNSTGRTWQIRAGTSTTDTNFRIYDETATTDRLVINSSGDVGIGTVTPTAALSIKSATANNTTGDGFTNLRLEYAGGYNAGDYGAGLTFAQQYVAPATDAAAIRVGGIFGVKTQATGNFGGGLAFFRQPAGAANMAEAMRIDQNGNVGIGTTTPTTKLEISNSSSPVVRVLAGTGSGVDDDNLLRLMPQNTSGEGGHLEFKGSTSNQDWTIDTVGGDLRIFEPGQSRNSVKTRGGITFSINTSTTSTPSVLNDALKIASTGDIGVGTGTPQAKLDIFGSTYFASRKGYASYYNVGPYDQMEFGAVGASTSLSLVTSGVSRLNVTPLGNVGIGITTPGSKLDVKGDNVNNTFRTTDVSGQFRTRIDQFYDFYMTNASGTDTLLIKNSGSIGIGTNTPSQALHIAGDRKAIFGPNSSWGANLIVGGNGWVGPDATVVATDGNLHLESRSGGYSTYVNWYAATGGLRVGNGTGGGYGPVLASAFTVSSDERLKKDIKILESASDKISQIRGVSYNYKDKKFNQEVQIGVIAQEVQKVYPEAVLKDEKGFLSVNYAILVAPLIQAFKELKSQVEEFIEGANQQSREIASLKQENAQLKREMEEQKRKNDEIKAYLCEQNPKGSICSQN